MTSDEQLLREYTENQSEQAFAELVNRHINLVYSVAVRRVGGDSQLAQDVVQDVFTDLARKAPSLPHNVVLGGWLYRHTTFTASKAVRTERRRLVREMRALEMNANNQSTEPSWEQIAPSLDEAMLGLRPGDRDAIVLRYFEQRDIDAVGTALGTSEEAARKRISRALEKLRSHFARRGTKLSVAALGSMLATQAVISAPVGLAVNVTGAAVAAVAASPGIVFALLKIMSTAKIKVIAAGTLIAAATVTPLILQHQAHHRLLIENVELHRQMDLAQSLLVANEKLLKSPIDTVATMALVRERNDRQAERAELMRLRGQVSVARLDANAKNSQVQRRVAQQEAIRQMTWTNPPPNYMMEIPIQLKVVLSAARNVGAGTPETALESYVWAVQQQDLTAWRNLKFSPDYQAAFANTMAVHHDEGILALEKKRFAGVTVISVRTKQIYGADQNGIMFSFERDPARPDSGNDEATGGEVLLKKIGEDWKVIGMGTVFLTGQRNPKTATP